MKRHMQASALAPLFAALALAMMLIFFTGITTKQVASMVSASSSSSPDQISAHIRQTTHIRQATVVSQEVYLPIILLQRSVISGHVTQNGSPLVGAPVSLQWVAPGFMHPGTLKRTVTDENGNYQFVNVRSTMTSTLGQGERYRAAIYGDLTWYTPLITYTAGTDYSFKPVDTTSITLLDPPADTTITLPYTFTWTVRPDSPTDSYGVNFFWAPGILGEVEVGYNGSAVVPLSILQGNEFPYMDWFVRIYTENGFGDTEMKRINFAWNQ